MLDSDFVEKARIGFSSFCFEIAAKRMFAQMGDGSNFSCIYFLVKIFKGVGLDVIDSLLVLIVNHRLKADGENHFVFLGRSNQCQRFQKEDDS